MADGSAILCQSSKANTPAIASAATALAANANRSAWAIQNHGTNLLYVRLGSGASSTVFHTVLVGATVQDDGSGGVISQEAGTVYTGIITIAGSSPRYTVLELGVA